MDRWIITAEIHTFLIHKRVDHFTEAIQQLPPGLGLRAGAEFRSLSFIV